MENLFKLMRLYGCDYINSINTIKSTFTGQDMESMKQFFANPDSVVDCGMATTGLVTLYCLDLIEREHLETIEQLLKDPTNPDETMFTIPRDGVVDKNMLLRLLPKLPIENSSFKVQYFRTNYLQDKLLNLNLNFQSTSWGMWCIDMGPISDEIPGEFLYRSRENYDVDESLYAFFNGKDPHHIYRWVIGSKKDLEEVTEKACIRDLEKSLEGHSKSHMIIEKNIDRSKLFEIFEMNYLRSILALVKKDPKILDLELKGTFTHYIPNSLDLEKILHYLTDYATSLLRSPVDPDPYGNLDRNMSTRYSYSVEVN